MQADVRSCTAFHTACNAAMQKAHTQADCSVWTGPHRSLPPSHCQACAPHAPASDSGPIIPSASCATLARLIASSVSRSAGTCDRSFSGWHTSLCCRLRGSRFGAGPTAHDVQLHAGQAARQLTRARRGERWTPEAHMHTSMHADASAQGCPPHAPVCDLALARAVCGKEQGSLPVRLQNSKLVDSCWPPTQLMQQDSPSIAAHRRPCSGRTAGSAAQPLAACRSLPGKGRAWADVESQGVC